MITGPGGLPQIKAFSGVGLVAGGMHMPPSRLPTRLNHFSLSPRHSPVGSRSPPRMLMATARPISSPAPGPAAPRPSKYSMDRAWRLWPTFWPMRRHSPVECGYTSVNTGSGLAADIVTAPSTGGEPDINVFGIAEARLEDAGQRSSLQLTFVNAAGRRLRWVTASTDSGDSGTGGAARPRARRG